MSSQKVNLTHYLTLPRMDAVSIRVLGQELLAAAQDKDAQARKGKKAARRALPAHVDEALDDVEREVEQMTAVLGAAPASPPGIRAVDRRMDRVIRALERICEGWSLLAGELAHGDLALAVHDRLFSEGLDWINTAPRKQWGVMDTKLKTVEDDGLRPRLDELGLVPVLELAKRLHAEYGQVVGVTTPREAEESPEIRERMNELGDAIRGYALRVVGMYQRSRPETAELVHELLKPIADLRRARRKATDGSAEDDGADAGTDGAAG